MTSLTTTSFAILGLLHLRPYSAYELAAQSGRSLRFVWPTAPSRLYAEPKRLAAEGLIDIVEQPAGPTRTRKEYRITPAGRAALSDWLAGEPAPPRLEAEVLLRVLLADAGTDDDLLATLETTREQVEELNWFGRAMLETYVAGDVEFPERLHLNMLWALLVRDLLQLVHDWTDFAQAEVERWSAPEDRGDTERARELLEAIVEDRPLLTHRPMARPTREVGRQRDDEKTGEGSSGNRIERTGRG